MKKITTSERRLLETCIADLRPVYRTGEHPFLSYNATIQVSGSVNLRIADRLTERGLLSKTVYQNVVCYYTLTPAGWQALGKTPRQLYLDDLLIGLAYEVAQIEPGRDSWNVSDYRLDFIRSIYGNPEMSVYDVAEVERARVCQNIALHAQAIQTITRRIFEVHNLPEF